MLMVDAANLELLKGSKETTTALQSIKGACSSALGAYCLHQFMINNKLQNYWGKSKGKMCSMIVERKKIWMKLCILQTLMMTMMTMIARRGKRK
jgi:hypothetical protein